MGGGYIDTMRYCEMCVDNMDKVLTKQYKNELSMEDVPSYDIREQKVNWKSHNVYNKYTSFP